MAFSYYLHYMQVSKPKLIKIYKAFENDCENLLLKFSDIKNGTYEDFVNVWDETGMSLTLICHRREQKIRCFCAKALEIALNLFLAAEINYSRIGALYLLFTLFEKQRVRFNHHIKVNLTEFTLLTTIVKELFDQGYEDAKGMYLVLKNNNAFEYIIDYKKSYSRPIRKLCEDSEEATGETPAADEMNEAFENIIAEISQLKDDYLGDFEEVKGLVDKMIAASGDDTELIQMRENLCEVNDKLSNVTVPKIVDVKCDTEVCTLEESQIALNRKMLRKKAVALRNEPKHIMSSACGNSSVIDDNLDEVEEVANKEKRVYSGYIGKIIKYEDGDEDKKSMSSEVEPGSTSEVGLNQSVQSALFDLINDENNECASGVEQMKSKKV